MGAIIENPIYGRMTLETAAWSTPFTWVDRSAAIVNAINYASGGRVGLPGQSQTDVGTLNATFKDLATPPVVGDLVRLQRTGTSEYAWVGYVQDVSQRIVFDDSVSYTTPVVLTTINCLDWVGYISQFQAVGVGGINGFFVNAGNNYTAGSRCRALNNVLDATNATQIIDGSGSALNIFGDTDMVGTFSDHLDLLAISDNLYWHAVNVLPTNKTTGRTGLVRMRQLSSAPSSGKTFTDAVGTSGQLHYIEIDLESSSQNIANTFVINNHSRITALTPEVTRIGGARMPAYGVINNVEVISADFTANYSMSDATSITTYGNRATEINTNRAGISQDINLVGNPSMEYGDDGWFTGASRMARRDPLDTANPFAAADGKWALRYRLASGPASTPSFRYSGSENDGIPVVVGTDYMFQASGARGLNAPANTRFRAYIKWEDEAGGTISTVYGAQVSATTQYTWYTGTVQGAAPAGAERAIVGLEFNRPSSGTFSAGHQFWLDAAIFRKSASASAVTYFDGDTPSDANSIYLWTGELGLSPTFKVENTLFDIGDKYLTRYSTTSNRITRIRWNAQEDLTAVSAMHVGSTISVVYDGTTTNHRIVGIDGNISTNRYMIDYYLEKV
jgi:hypothetical protein